MAPRHNTLRNRTLAEQEAGDLGWFRGFEHTGTEAFAAFHADGAGLLAYSIGRFRAMMPAEGVERPVGIGNHVDRALLADQDGHCGAGSGGFGGLQDI